MMQSKLVARFRRLAKEAGNGDLAPQITEKSLETSNSIALKAAGVSAFIYAGCDVLSTLQATHDKLGLT